MRLVYLSPVPWASFAQRPHKMINWYHARTGSEVLWIDPYPARLPRLSDLTRKRSLAKNAPPPWLSLAQPRALPIEPLPVLSWFNSALWKPLLAKVDRFVGPESALLAFGKPSMLALLLQARFPRCTSLYDAMDDFPSFHTGLARRAMRRREQQLVDRSSLVWASSTTLQWRWSRRRDDVRLVPNGLDAALLPLPRARSGVSPLVFGYVGTMGAWFDWDLVAALARIRPQDRVRLIGPLDVRPHRPLPANVELLPPCAHAAALHAMNAFDVGLIPFRRTDLTACVDPIKYYEYRALGLPVISTDFGDMTHRECDPGVFLVRDGEDLETVAARAAQDCVASQDPLFVFRNTWEGRFDASGLLTVLGALSSTPHECTA